MHDIGKNIVGVVLGCNNFEVIDLGVMVSCEKILEEAVKHGVDMIGLSGLITPSLDEMVHVAKEMKRTGMEIPLLIGGATTSDKHTAVKIAPQYEHGVVHVLDASRSVGVVEQLMGDESRAKYLQQYSQVQSKLVASYEERQMTLVPYDEALANRFPTDWSAVDIPKPGFTGVRTLGTSYGPADLPAADCEVSLNEIAEYIDWSPFFASWELHGKYPRIFEDDVVGQEAKKLFQDAQEILSRLIQDNLLAARGVFGFWPAQFRWRFYRSIHR